MNLAYSILLVGLMSAQAGAKEQDTKTKGKTLKPLSEEFLLFLAEMEEVEGELMHPVDVADSNLKKAETKQVVKRTVGKKDEDIE